MRKALGILVILAGCTPPPPMPVPAPTSVTSPFAPPAVVQTAVQTLAMRGFTVTTGDATNGIVVASKTVAKGAAKELFACRWGPDAVGWNMVDGSVTVTVTARAIPSGSAVMIVGAAHSVGHLYGMPDTQGECVSNGAAEAEIAKEIASK